MRPKLSGSNTVPYKARMNVETRPVYLLWMQMQECSTAPTTHRLHRKRGAHEWEGPHKRKTDSTYSVMCKILEKENWELFQQMQKTHRAKPQHPFITHGRSTLHRHSAPWWRTSTEPELTAHVCLLHSVLSPCQHKWRNQGHPNCKKADFLFSKW